MLTPARNRRRHGRRRFIATLLAAGAAATGGLARPVWAQEAGATPAATPPASPVPDMSDRQRADLEIFITQQMEQFGVLGAAVAVVQGNDVSFLAGFGRSALEGEAPVSSRTMMMVDSLTKPITSLLAATLVDSGDLVWETPVQEMLPEFTLADPERARQISIAQCFCHCAGLPRNDPEMLFNAAEITPEGLIAAAARLQPNAGIGEQFQYSNHLYAIGGYAAAVAAGDAGSLGDAYHEAMRSRVLDPIGMTQSTFMMADATAHDDYALPAAATLNGDVVALLLEGEEEFANAVEPAGGLWSNVSDMARFVQTVLAGGIAPEGGRVVSAASLGETWRSRIAIPPDPGLPPVLGSARAGYGLGWFAGDLGGTPVISHDGGVAGFISQMTLLPEAGLGVVVLTNGGRDARPFATGLPFRVLELLLGGPPQVEGLLVEQAARSTAQAQATRASLGEVDPAAVEPYLGQYTSPALGDVGLSLEDGQLMFDAGEVRSALLPGRDESGQPAGFRFVAPPLSVLPVSVLLQLDADGRPAMALAIAGQEGAGYPFTRETPG